MKPDEYDYGKFLLKFIKEQSKKLDKKDCTNEIEESFSYNCNYDYIAEDTSEITDDGFTCFTYDMNEYQDVSDELGEEASMDDINCCVWNIDLVHDTKDLVVDNFYVADSEPLYVVLKLKADNEVYMNNI